MSLCKLETLNRSQITRGTQIEASGTHQCIFCVCVQRNPSGTRTCSHQSCFYISTDADIFQERHTRQCLQEGKARDCKNTPQPNISPTKENLTKLNPKRHGHSNESSRWTRSNGTNRHTLFLETAFVGWSRRNLDISLTGIVSREDI